MNQKGQAVVEMVLIMVVVMGLTAAIFGRIRSEDWMGGLVQGSWSPLSGMLENGVWGTPEQTRTKHPGLLSRHLSTRDE